MKPATAPKKGAKKKFCIESGCKLQVQAHGYCRLHYLSNWRIIKFDVKIKAERRLNAYVDGMSKRFPKDFMERIKEGLESDGKFRETIEILGVEESSSSETEREFVEKMKRSYKIDE